MFACFKSFLLPIDWLLTRGEKNWIGFGVIVLLWSLGDSALLCGIVGRGENPSIDLVTSSERSSSPSNKLKSSFAF